MDVNPAALIVIEALMTGVTQGKKVSRHRLVIHSSNIEHYCGVTLKSAKSKEHCGN